MNFRRMLTVFVVTGLIASFILWFTPWPVPPELLKLLWIQVGVLAICETIEGRDGHD